MKIIKKLITAVSSLAVVTTLLSTMVVQAASSNPVITLRLDDTQTENVYNLAVNVDTSNCEMGSKIYALTLYIPMDVTNFDNDDIVEMNEDEEYINIDCFNAWVEGGTFTYNENNSGNLAFSNASTKKAPNMSEADDLIVFKNIKLKDGVTTDQILEISDFMIEVGADEENTKAYGYSASGNKDFLAVDTLMTADEFNSVTIKATSTTPAGPTITKVGSFADGENDKAVAYMFETTAVEGNTVTATGTITLANGDTMPATLKPQSVNASLETNGAVALGIIVQFDGTWKDFVITEMAIN